MIQAIDYALIIFFFSSYKCSSSHNFIDYRFHRVITTSYLLYREGIGTIVCCILYPTNFVVSVVSVIDTGDVTVIYNLQSPESNNGLISFIIKPQDGDSAIRMFVSLISYIQGDLESHMQKTFVILLQNVYLLDLTFL